MIDDPLRIHRVSLSHRRDNRDDLRWREEVVLGFGIHGVRQRRQKRKSPRSSPQFDKIQARTGPPFPVF